MTDLTIRTIDGCSLAVRDEGRTNGMPVLFSHSLGTNLSIWDPVAAAAAQRFRVIRYDSRGHGASDAPLGPYDVAMFARDTLAVLDALEIRRAHFVGLSQGGMTGMHLAAHHPERISRLVLANTTAFIPARERFDALIHKAVRQGMDAIAAPTIIGWLSPQFKAVHLRETADLVEVMRTMSRAGYAGACAALRDADLRNDLGNILAPTLVINGVEDGELAAAAAAALTAGIRGARRVDLPDAAHLSPIETPVSFSQAVLEFLA